MADCVQQHKGAALGCWLQPSLRVNRKLTPSATAQRRCRLGVAGTSIHNSCFRSTPRREALDICVTSCCTYVYHSIRNALYVVSELDSTFEGCVLCCRS